MAYPSTTSRFPPLDTSKPQIRLIHLQPRRAGEDITCSLHLADLDDEVCHYEALSYEWGDAKKADFSIILDEKKFAVRENLQWALWHLRYEETIRIIWIDALCIDQVNERERNHQVGQMGRIYARAERVVAWIGREEQEITPGGPASTKAGVESAIDFVQLLNLHVEKAHKKRGDSPIECPEDSCPYKLVFLRESTSAINSFLPLQTGFEGLCDLCYRTYWGRLWIIQELVLASQIIIQCGRFQLKWSVLENTLGFIEDINSHIGLFVFNNFYFDTPCPPDPGTLLESFPAKISQLRENRIAPGNLRSSLFDLFHIYIKAACADLRDKVFGLLALSSLCCQKAIPADYRMSPFELCRSLLSHQLISHHNERTDLHTLWCRVLATFKLFKDKLEDKENLGDLLFSRVPSIKTANTIAQLSYSPQRVVRQLNRSDVPAIKLSVDTEDSIRSDLHFFNRDLSKALIFGPRSPKVVLDIRSNLFKNRLLNILSGISGIPDRFLLILWAKSKCSEPEEAFYGERFITIGDWVGYAFGEMQVGDLVCNMSQDDACMLRRNGQHLLVTAHAFSACGSKCGLSCTSPLGKDLFLDFSILRAFCMLFHGDSKLLRCKVS